MKTLIKNGIVIDPKRRKEEAFDVAIDSGKILGLEKPGSAGDKNFDKVIDASGKLVVPGLVDLHVHLREPGFEWKETIETGCRAAVTGGFTTVCSMPNTSPVNDSSEVTYFILEKARAAGLAKVRPIGAISKGLLGKEMAPLSELAHAGCVAFSDDGEPVWDSGLMRRALEWSSMIGVPLTLHEEDKCLSECGSMNESALSLRLGLTGSPTVAEDVMIARDIEIARYTNGTIHICHVSTARGVELIRRAKNDGIKITAEVTPHHLVLTEEAVSEYDTNAKMNPPLRRREDVEALRSGLKDGTIDCIASDHAPHEFDKKECEFSAAAFGILGLQTTLPLLLELAEGGVISRTRAIEAMSSRPAEIFKLGVGTLSNGAPADIAVIDPAFKWEFDKSDVVSKSFNSPFFGRTLKGAPSHVMVDGRVVFERGAR